MLQIDKIKLGIAERIKSIRLNLRGMTQEEFAASLGYTRGTYSAWERGINEPPLEAIIKICNQRQVNLHWLITGEYPVPTKEFEQVKETQVEFLKTSVDIQSKYIQCLEQNSQLIDRIKLLESNQK